MNLILVSEKKYEKASQLYREASLLHRNLKVKASHCVRTNGSLITGYWEYTEAAEKAKARKERRGKYLVKLSPVW